MSVKQEHDSRPSAGSRSRRRPRQQAARTRTVRFDLTEEEFAELEQAAGRAGLAKGAYAAEAALSAARGRRSAGPGPVPDQRAAVRGTRMDHPRTAGGPPRRGTAVRGVVRWTGRDRGGGTAMIGKVPDGPDKRGERCEGLIYYL